MLQIIIQGRGGQGAQTAGNLLAQAFFAEGKQVQSFASYGGARRGTPVSSMIRIDDSPIRLRCDIERADAVLCFDKSLLDARLLRRADRDALIVVNSAESQDKSSSPGDRRILHIDAVAISQEKDLGRLVNSALLGAFCCLLGSPSLDTMAATILEAAPVKQQENVAACRAGFQTAKRQFVQNDSIRAAGAK
ncbi:MAG: 2-oxoacid:acceptor oxidoreductase family protein [Woeseiaceae bacterium]